ncbi:MAG: hypothetical protein ABL877_02495 [Thiobacillus sp.]
MIHRVFPALFPALQRMKQGLRALTARSARFALGTVRTQCKALLLVSSVMSAPVIQAALPPGTTVTNTATATYTVGGTPVSINDSVSLTTPARSPAVIEFLQYVPSGGVGAPETVNPTQCGGGPLPAPNYIFPPSTPLVVPGALQLVSAGQYSAGDPVFIRVTDHDQNLNAAVPETITVTVTTSGGDSETLTLTETGISTGVFTGYIQSTSIATSSGNCTLDFPTSQTLTASYTDPLDAVTTVTDAALVDPFGIVFDSSTGVPVNAAIVTLIDTVTNLPATVYCDDGVTVLPQPVNSGATTVCDPVMQSGGYRFPRVVPGTYRLAIVPPGGYAFPSAVAPGALPGVYIVVGIPGSGASYGGSFPLNPGPAVRIDVPLDLSGGGTLEIIKTANKSVVSEGEFVPYTLTVRNAAAVAAVGVQIADRLPAGFRYQAGSARLDNAVLSDPAIAADGRTLTFSLGNIAAGASVTLKYVAEVTATARTGKAENTAFATGGHSSNTARASVTVREDLMRSRAILLGRVIIGSCDDKVNNDANGLAQARVVLQDGTAVLTDEHGRWHADNLRPGTHVVQLDLDSLPPDYEVVRCEKNSRFAGRSYSQFVNLRGGSLWRADFHVQKKAQPITHVTQQLSAQRVGDLVLATLTLTGDAAVSSVSATLMLPASAKLVDASPRLNQQPTTQLEASEGLAILRLGAQTGRWTHTLQFELDAAPTDAALIAMTRFVPPSQQGINLPQAEARWNNAPTETRAVIPPAVLHADIPDAPGTMNRGQRTRLTVQDAVPQVPGSGSRSQLVEQLPYDADWLATTPPGVEWLHPQTSFQPALPAIKLAVKHAPGQRLELTLDGTPVNPLNYDGMEQNATRTVGLSLWRGVALREGKNTFELVVRDATGAEVMRETRVVQYSTGPDRVEFVAAHSRLLADGKTRPVIAVRFLDKDGVPVRRGVNGDFQLNAPYQSSNQLEAIQREPLAGKIDNRPRYEIGRDGIAMIELAPTTQSGEAVLSFDFNGQSSGNSQRKNEIRAWLAPGQRDWILVGFAEGTVGHKTLSGNVAALKNTGDDKALFDDNRIALYAKGTVRGDTLLTVAYDTAKRRGDAGAFANLKQAVDPSRFYTLYADSTQPTFDAASARKLYLKIERRQFYALFGDYDTGLTVTEFSRYSRTVNGLKSEYQGKQFAYNAFATLTAQAFVKDELRGNGTSGRYQLSRRELIENSDKIRLETRDRFQSQTVVSSQSLTRHLDYDIDYQQGTLFFKSPVLERDAAFNPIYIVAEYESTSSQDEKLTAGGRVAFKPNAQTELGASYVREGNVGASGNLGGLDLTYLLNDHTRLQAEYAQSDRSFNGSDFDGSAWKVEALHHDDTRDAKIYVRQQDGGFGLGQQAGSENGTRKFGAEGRLKLSDSLQLQGQAYRQSTLGTGAQRDVIEARADQKFGTGLTGYYGARFARDEDGTGDTRDSKQLLAGAAYELLDRKLVLRAAAEIGLGDAESLDFPNRLILGADYKLTEHTALFAEQEFARGDALSANLTRVGLRTQPWSGGELAASLGNQFSLDSGRIHADLGLTQKWQVNEFWQTDFAVTRSNTLKLSGTPQNLNVPLASGSTANGDYTAISLGANYNNTVWGANTRLEWREGDTDDKLNFLVGVQRTLDAGRVLSGGFSYLESDTALSRSRKFDARFSYAHRPWDSEWIWLNRLDYIDELITDATLSSHARKLVNNSHWNWMPNRRTQLAMQFGAKYVLDTIDSTQYSGFTSLVGAEIRRDIGQDWDIGAHASILNSWNSQVRQTALGVSLGHSLLENMWVSVGYNFAGFNDADFAGADTHAQGPYLSVRMKIDQDTLKLNDQEGGISPRTQP